MPLPKRPYNYDLVDGIPPRSHPLYTTWHNMMRRCYSEYDRSYKNYGGRGIVVEESWWIFKNFVDDMGIKPSPLHTLERIDNTLGYSKWNCKWASRSEQSSNRRIFRNSKSGIEGVVPLKNGTFQARLDYEGVRYSLGRFATCTEATDVRIAFKDLFFKDRKAAIATIPKETVWSTSHTGIRGVTKHEDGGYIVRTTVNKERIYLGYFKTLEEAIDAKRRGNKS